MLQLLKPTCLEPMFCNEKRHLNEKPMQCNKGYLCSPQLEKALLRQRRPTAVKIKKEKQPQSASGLHP